MSGLFVQKHVEAVRAQGVDVRVIFSQGWCDTWRQWRALRREGWIPDVVQLNVIQKQGLLALWLKKRYGIPYIIVEHWSGYLPENGQFARFSALKKSFIRYICQKAEQVLTVSMPLQQAMRSCGMEAKRWGLIDNVVDDFFFEKGESKEQEQNQKILLHVSCFDEKAKNVKGLLRAAKILGEKRQDWQLVLVGTGIDYSDIKRYAQTLDIPENLLLWTGELSPKEVAEWMRCANALILTSRYETYGIVLAEAFTADLPILSTPVGIAEQVGAHIVEQEIAQHHPELFAEQIEEVLFSDRQRLAEISPERFSAQTIGRQLKAIYDSCLHHHI